MTESSRQLDLFPTSEPEIKGQLAAFAFLIRGLIETLIGNGSLTPEQAKTLLHHSDLKSVFAIWDELKSEMPDAELQRMEQQRSGFWTDSGMTCSAESVFLLFEAENTFAP